MKKQWVLAVLLLLMMPLVLMTGGVFFSLINPEIAAGHPDYVRNYHLLNSLRLMCVWGSFAVVGVLWLMVCFLVIRSKKRSYLWMLLAALGPFGFAILATLKDGTSGEADRYTRFVRRLSWPMRIGYEVGSFALLWVLAYEGMVLKRTLTIWYQSWTTGMSTAQIIDLQNASSGMWAFAEGNEVIFLVILLYLLRPLVFNIVGGAAAALKSHHAH